MKMFWKNEDRVIDSLLRANAKGRGGANPACREFDPDLANAYVERSLTAKERAGYELHLFDCHACRSSVVALTRMYEAEAGAFVRTQPVREASPFATLKGLFTTSAMPRMAAAALAVIVLAVSIPLLMSRKGPDSSGQSPSNEVAVDQRANVADSPATPALTPAPDASKPDLAETRTAATEEARPARREQEQSPATQGESVQPKPTPAEPDAASGVAGRARVDPPQPERVEAKSVADQPRKDESAAAVAKEQAAPPPPPPAPAVAESQGTLGRIETEDARRLKQQERDAVSVTIKPGHRGGASGLDKADRAAIVPADAVAPPSQNAPAGNRDRRRLAQPSPRSSRDDTGAGGAAFAPRGSATRKVGSKKFWLSKDTWTDKDYNPNKELPVVTVERDSDIYKEMLTKRSGLKLYLQGFGEGERAIFVYKGTVYRLVPQQSR